MYENIFFLYVFVKLVLYWYIILIEYDWELIRMLCWIYYNFCLVFKKGDKNIYVLKLNREGVFYNYFFDCFNINMLNVF